MSNIYVIIESYIDIGGTTTYTYLGYVAMESEAYKYVFDLNEKKRTWKNQAEASCTSYYYGDYDPDDRRSGEDHCQGLHHGA